MRKKYLMVLLSGMVCLSSFIGCGKKDAKESSTDNVTKEESEKEVSVADLEEAELVEGNTYSNSKLGFSYTMPEGWSVNGADQAYQFMADANGIDKEPYKMRANNSGTYNISVASFEANEDSGDSYSLVAYDKKITGNMDIEELIDSFIDSSKQQYTTQGNTFTGSEPEKITIGTQDVYSIEATITFPEYENEIMQVYHFFTRNGVSVMGVLTLEDKKDAAVADDILSSMKFE